MDQQMQQAHTKMDQAMQAGMQAGVTPDERFVRMMIQHHQGAVDMSKMALEQIKNPELRRMAQKTMKKNQREIQEMNAWLSTHGKSASTR